jgi:alkylation response protein AidB-like acyl-CoA dehydrogenase
MEHGAANERAGQLVPEVITKVTELGLQKMLVPQSLGGLGGSIVDELEIVEELAYADASTAWVVFASGLSTSTAAAYLPDQAVAEIFGPDKVSLIAGAGAPTGVAHRVEGGYRLTGRWAYGSGMLHADWSHSGAFVHENGEICRDANGAPLHLIFHVPTSQVRCEGNWDVLGLRATGSVDYAIEDAFVPDAFVYPAGITASLRRPEIFNLGLLPIASIGHAGWAAGVGRRILDELSSYARSKGMRAGSLATSDSFAERYAEAEARMRSARAFLFETWSTLEAKMQDGNPAETRDITLARLALANITYAATEVSEFAYRIAGGEPLRQGTFQRIYRDIHSGSQHLTSAASVVQTCGKDLAGLAPDHVWQLGALVPEPKGA